MPRTTKYAEPAYLTMPNPTAEDTSSAERPRVAATTCTNVPVQIPATDTRPAARPCSMLRVTMYSTAGPGVMRSAIAAPTNRPRRETSGTEEAYDTLHHDRGAALRLPILPPDVTA